MKDYFLRDLKNKNNNNPIGRPIIARKIIKVIINCIIGVILPISLFLRCFMKDYFFNISFINKKTSKVGTPTIKHIKNIKPIKGSICKSTILVVVLSLFFSSIPLMPVNATRISAHGGSGYSNDGKWKGWKNWTITQKANSAAEVMYMYLRTHYGYIINDRTTFSETFSQKALDKWNELNDGASDYTYDEFMASLYTYDEDSDEFDVSDTFITIIDDSFNTYRESSGYVYCYTVPFANFVQRFPSYSIYQELSDVVSQCENSGIMCGYSPGLGNLITFEEPYECLVVNGTYEENPYIDSYKDWIKIEQRDRYSINTADSNNPYINYNDFSESNLIQKCSVKSSPNFSVGTSSWSGYFFVTTTKKCVKVYMSIEAMKSDTSGVPCYYQIDNSENYNKVNSDNVQSWINNYYNEHNEYPTNNQVNEYINNYTYNTDVDLGGNGNGNGSGGTSVNGQGVVQSNEQTVNANPIVNVYNNIKINISDLLSSILGISVDNDDPSDPEQTDPAITPTPTPSPSVNDPTDPNITPTPSPDPGNGTGSDDNTGDKDKKSVWKRIGDLLGSVFSGVGNFILGILEKLVDLIVGDNGILTAIQGIIDNLITGIPNIIGSLIEYFLPFLPEELIALVSLTVVLAILLAVIRIIRGK